MKELREQRQWYMDMARKTGNEEWIRKAERIEAEIYRRERK